MRQIKFNSILPTSPEYLIEEYKGLRDAEPKRDEMFSPLHDSILTALSSNLDKYAKGDVKERIWMTMFPERAAKEILRLVEQFIISETTEIEDFEKHPYKGVCGKCGNYNEKLNRDCLCDLCVLFGVTKKGAKATPEIIMKFVKPRF